MSKMKILSLTLALIGGISLLALTSCNDNTLEPESVTESQAEVVESSSGIEFTLSDDGSYYIISGYNGTAKKIVCGDTHKNLPIKEIGNNAFANTSIETVKIADSITKIGEYAFFNCDELTQINLGDGLKEIGEYSFSACKLLSHVTFPEGFTTIGNNAFFSSQIISVNIPESIECIGLNAFDSCPSLRYSRYDNAYYLGNPDNKYVALITTVEGLLLKEEKTPTTQKSYSVHVDAKIIASGAFENHKSLEKVTISQNTIAIGDLAFANCSNLNSVTLPQSLKSIGVSAFAYCTKLTSINLPTELTDLGDGAFRSCGLTVAVIPNSVKEIASYTFIDCKSLTKINLGSSVKSIGSFAFFGCENLAEVILSDYFQSKLTNIGAFAFDECKHLKTIYLPSSITSIGEKAFSDYVDKIYCFHTKEQWASTGLSNAETFASHKAKVYLYSENTPTLNAEGTGFDGKYFKIDEEGRLIDWIFVQA